jgi:beta-lactamase regulating signal transducer with metallopeptidase domain
MGGFAAAGTFGLIAEYFLKTTVVLTLALFAAGASRRRPAAFRHFVLSFALIGLLLLPLLSLAPVGWRTTLLPARPAENRAQAALPVRLGEPLDQARALGVDIRSAQRLAIGVAEPAPPGSAAARTAELHLEWSPQPAAAVSGPVHIAAFFPPLKQAAGSPVNIVLAVLWSAGLIALVLRLAVGLAGAVKLTAEGEVLGGPAWREILERYMELVSLRREIRLRSHPAVLVPLTWGFRKPVVLMPVGTDAWTEEERSSALFHELSHVKRADFLVMLLVRTSLAAFWFNPLCWIVYRELRKEQEIACDELVLRAGIRPSTYAASLLAFRRSAGFRWNPSTALLGMLGRSPFHARLAAILKQKLTFKEVKMKTKIMLASAVVLAVALVGTARPAVGTEKNAALVTVVESALPAPASFEAALPVLAAQEKQAEKAVVQEKEKEKAKKGKPAGKNVVVTTKEGTKTPIVITITEGDEVKTLILDKPLTITRGEGGHTLVLSAEGKDIQVLEGEPLSLAIEGGAVELLKEGKALKVGEGGSYKIIHDGEKEGSQVVIYWAPAVRPAKGEKIRIIKEGVAVEAAPEAHVTKMKVRKEGETWVVAEPVTEGKAVTEGAGEVKVVLKKATEVEPEITWVAKETGKEGAVWVTKEFSGKPAEGAWMAEGGQAFAFSSATDKEMLERVHALQEQVAAIKAKKMDITALEESLKKLEAELAANTEKLGQLHMTFEKRPEGLTIAKKIHEYEAQGGVVHEKTLGDKAEGETAVWISKGAEGAAIAKIGVSMGDNSVRIVFVGKGAGPEEYERTVAKLKKELPEGCKLLEQKFDPENGTMTFKIAAPEGKKIDEQTIRKLVDIFKTEPKK